MRLAPSTKVYLSESKIMNAGRGMFSTQTIKAGEVIERCPIILIPETEIPSLRQTKLLNYYFMWGDDPRHHRAGICLGFGSLYNHSYSPNATYKKLIEEELIEFVALQDIHINE